jgi:hypothetical protein
MPAPVIPTKTALGQEELRRRTGGLGQRHRTILFLIDGKRPLSEVLSLAQKAGAATSHFEDLVRLGHVEMPPEEFAPTVPVAELLEEAQEPPADVAELTHVELTVPAEAPGEDEAPPPVPETVSETVVLAPAPEPAPEPPPAAAPVAAAAPAAHGPTPVSSPPAPIAAPAVAAALPAIGLPNIGLPPSAPPARTPVAEAVEELVDESEPLGKVRRCLLDALYMDPTPFGFRAAMRVRTARTTAALIEIVWEMERDMGLSMRSRSGLQNLQRARELLGLGNTLVDEDTQSPRPDDSTW